MKSERETAIMQAAAMYELEGAKRELEAGNKSAIFFAIAQCARADLVMPDWLARAFLGGYHAVVNGRADNWDSAFGSAHPKGTRIAKVREIRSLAPAVWLRAQELHRAGLPLGVELFEDVGAEFGIGKTKASEFYYYCERQMARGLAKPLTRELLAPFVIPRKNEKTRLSKKKPK